MKNRRFVFSTQSAKGIFASLSLVLGLSSVVHAQIVDAPAKPGEIIIEVSSDMPRPEVDALASEVGCVVVKPLAYSPGYYLLSQKTRAAQGVRRGGRAFVPDATLRATIEALRAKPGVKADPNYLAELTGSVPPQATNRTNGATTRGKTRAAAPPSPVTFEPNDPYFTRGQMWGLEMIRMPEAYAIQLSVLTAPVVVEVIDSGADVNSPDLTGQILPASRNFTDDQPNNLINDYDGHGTHVSGTIAAVTNNGAGVSSVAGYAGGGVNVKILTGKIFDSRPRATGTTPGSGPNTATLGALIEAVKYGASQKVDVMNLSLGFPGFFGQPVSSFPQTAVDAFNAAFAAGATVCVSAGNDINQTTTGFPADVPGAIKVSAVNRQGTLARYSSTGGATAIAAPGGSGISEGDDDAIWSTWPSYIVSESKTATNYHSINGTSMACPHVSGVAALLVANGAVLPGTRGNNLVVKKIIQDSAAPIPGETPNPNGGGKYGAGLLDAYSAILPYANPPFSVGLFGAVSASVLQGVTRPANALIAGDLPYTDRGQTYSAQQTPLIIRAQGVSRKASTDVVTVELQTATIPETTLRVFTAGDPGPNGFDIPTLSAGVPRGTAFPVQVPRSTSGATITVPDGRYKFVLKLNGVPQAVSFFEKISRSQPLGRALFSTPFQVRQVDASTPEQTLFGPGTTFTLARYNPLRLPSDFDYALFQSGGGRSDAAARFSAGALNGEPLSFDTSNPSVSIAPVGLGYWLKLDSAVILNTSGAVVTNPVGVKCYAASGGWNMIGDPYPFAVAWGTVSVVANGQTYSLLDAVNARILSGAIVSYPNGDYQYDVAPGGTLQPFMGYWVRVYQDCTLIIAPTGGTTGSGRAVQSGAASTASPLTSGWKVRLGAFAAGDRDGQNFFGQVKAAKGISRVALPKPPSGAGHAYVRFVDSSSRAVAAKTGDGPMAYDLRPTASGTEGTTHETWTAEVSTDKPNADVVLTWDGIGTAPRRAGLFLTDSATGRKVSLRDRSSYSYKSGEAGSTRSFTITMEPVRTSGLLAIHNLTVSPFGKAVGGGMAIRFNANREADVTGYVKTFNGTIVGVLNGPSRAVASSTTTLHWTGRGVNGSALPAGAYQIEVILRDADGNTATAKQPVQSLR